MTSGEALFSQIREHLERRQRVSAVNATSGTLELQDDDRTVRVTLDQNLLEGYFQQLDEHDIPDLSCSAHDAHDRVRARHITMRIEEIFESDVSLSLLEIWLHRSPNGRISLVDRRGFARRSFPVNDTEGAYWSPDRPAG